MPSNHEWPVVITLKKNRYRTFLLKRVRLQFTESSTVQHCSVSPGATEHWPGMPPTFFSSGTPFYSSNLLCWRKLFIIFKSQNMFLCDTHFPKPNIFLGIWLDSPFWFDVLFLEITSFPMATRIKILNKSQMCTSTSTICLSCRIIFFLRYLKFISENQETLS